MVTPSKRKPPSRAAEAQAAPVRPFIRFYHSEELRAETLRVLAALEHAEDATRHAGELADIVVALLNSGLDYFFSQPLRQAKAGFILQQSANLGLAGAQQVMGSVVRKIIGRMDSAQLVSVCGSIREMMR